jgi:hypothetical protein
LVKEKIVERKEQQMRYNHCMKENEPPKEIAVVGTVKVGDVRETMCIFSNLSEKIIGQHKQNTYKSLLIHQGVTGGEVMWTQKRLHPVIYQHYQLPASLIEHKRVFFFCNAGEKERERSNAF